MVEIVNKFDSPSCDLVFKRTKLSGCTNYYSMSVDYVSTEGIKYLYILKGEFDYQQTIDLELPIDEDILNQKVKIINKNHTHQ